jgi:predicted CoA-substrate-specific enzyme activase
MLIGLDVGSRTAKRVDYDNKIISTEIVDTHDWKKLLEDAKGTIISTGYFRKKIPHDFDVTEITTAIYGVRHFIKDGIEAIVDIGGQDTKVIDLRTNDFRMNDKCSAGTGAFLEFIAKYFDIGIEDLERYHFQGEKIAEINSTCSVFAQSEVVSKLVEGYSKEEVIKGVHYAFARKIGQMIPIDAKKIAFIGGTVKNRGVVDAFEKVFRIKAHVPDEPQIVNAVGAVKYFISKSDQNDHL